MIKRGSYSSSPICKCIKEILNSRACHGAIRFGDKLSKERCKKLMLELSKCRLPFQCAHGRPSVAPILEFSTQRGESLFKSFSNKINLSKISQRVAKFK